MTKTVINRRKDLKTEFEHGISRTEILKNSYDEAQIFYCILEKNQTWMPEKYAQNDKCQFFIFVKGTGYVAGEKHAYDIKEPGVYVPAFDREAFAIHSASQLEVVHIVCTMSEYDKIAIKMSAISLPRFRSLSEGWTYDEDFKTPGTTSCMLVEHRNLGRFSVGSTMGQGPSCNGNHVHPDLEQWYIALPGSEFTYSSGTETYVMAEGDVSYTGHGVPHSSEAAAGQQLDYIWFELCADGYVGELPEDIWPVKK